MARGRLALTAAAEGAKGWCPFCWWMAIVVDHSSRLVVGFAIFKRRPTSFQLNSFLGMAIRRSGAKLKYIITDKGKAFFCQPSYQR